MLKRPKFDKEFRIFLAPEETEGEVYSLETTGMDLSKSLVNILNSGANVERLAFTANPNRHYQFDSVYVPKQRGLPDDLLKRISIQDSLVAAIVHARSNQMSAFGRPVPDRFSPGYVIKPHNAILNKLDSDQKADLYKKIRKTCQSILSCGSTTSWSDEKQTPFSRFLYEITRDAVVVGRFAVEVIHQVNQVTGEKTFHSFRPADAGTIYRSVKYSTAHEAVRKQAYHALKQLGNEKIIPERYTNDEYSWVQVIEGTPRQVFTPEEMLVENCYPVTDINFDGYPLTPLDTVMAEVTTHINITSHNKLYFQSGRASKGMLVIRSDDVSPGDVKAIKQQFQASINSVQNAWKMPVFSIQKEDDIRWEPIDNSSRDIEFQYLSDQNSRVILSSFQMSPDELPGYSHLSRATNSQTLSETSNEFKLTAARDVGIRPLLLKIQDFLNAKILPLIDPELAEFCTLELVGLEKVNQEQENNRIMAEMPIHLSYSEVLERVEKTPLPKSMGGYFPFNQQYQQILDKYFTVGQILEYFFEVKDASKDPGLNYRRDQHWFTWYNLQQAEKQAKEQKEMVEQQQAQAQQGTSQGQDGQQAPQKPAMSEEEKAKLDELQSKMQDAMKELE
jgi:hypothetical protein